MKQIEEAAFKVGGVNIISNQIEATDNPETFKDNFGVKDVPIFVGTKLSLLEGYSVNDSYDLDSPKKKIAREGITCGECNEKLAMTNHMWSLMKAQTGLALAACFECAVSTVRQASKLGEKIN